MRILTLVPTPGRFHWRNTPTPAPVTACTVSSTIPAMVTEPKTESTQSSADPRKPWSRPALREIPLDETGQASPLPPPPPS